MKIQIKDFISTKWAAYADYDNRRSLPHILDGLKITQRKAMYTATLLPKGDKPIRVSQFASKAAEVTAYHHGENSMTTTIIGLAQDFPGSNNYPWLEKHGQFGSRLANDAAAPRYIHTKLHKNWDRFFLPEDRAIVEYNYDDGDKIEPKYFIPVIPTILLNGANGVGNGFRSRILTYGLDAVVKAVKEVAKGGKVKTPLVPKIEGFSGEIDKQDKQVTFKGVLKIVHTTKIHITELPPKYDNDKYKDHLNKLIAEGFIKDYKNHSTEDKWDWVIDCPRTTTALPMDKLMDKFGLIHKISENFVCWGVDEVAPITFESPEELVEYWYGIRLDLYKKSLDHQIKTTEDEITLLGLKILFIKWCLKNDFRKLSRAEFIQRCVTEIRDMTEDYASKLVAMPIYRMTTDEVAKAKVELTEAVARLDELDALTPSDLMTRNLKAL